MFVIIIKSQEKIKPVKWSFLNFNLNGQNFAECKNQDYMLISSSMLNLHRVLFCTGIDFDDIMQIDWLISILFYIAFHWLVTIFGIVQYVIIGVPPNSAQFTSIRNQNF